jgi:hypothetical protein
MKTALALVYGLIVGPRALLFWAATILIAFGIVHALGWREFTTVLSGTIPKDNTEAEAAFKALAYMTTYFATVLVVPTLLIAAALNPALARICRISPSAR